jgi:hypothetical protein
MMVMLYDDFLPILLIWKTLSPESDLALLNVPVLIVAGFKCNSVNEGGHS